MLSNFIVCKEIDVIVQFFILLYRIICGKLPVSYILSFFSAMLSILINLYQRNILSFPFIISIKW